MSRVEPRRRRKQATCGLRGRRHLPEKIRIISITSRSTSRHRPRQTAAGDGPHTSVLAGQSLSSSKFFARRPTRMTELRRTDECKLVCKLEEADMRR